MWRNVMCGLVVLLSWICLSFCGGEAPVTNCKKKAYKWEKSSSGTSADLYGSVLLKTGHAWAVGAQGTILRSTDFGKSWSPQTSGTTKTLYSVSFVDKNNGWAVGESGVVRKTINGGESWEEAPSPSKDTLRSVQFLDKSTGFVVGDQFTISRTSNGGRIWLAADTAKDPQKATHFQSLADDPFRNRLP